MASSNKIALTSIALDAFTRDNVYTSLVEENN